MGKHLRDARGGSFFKLWSYLLKTIVMNVMREDLINWTTSCTRIFIEPTNRVIWKGDQLEEGFIQCLEELRKSLDVYKVENFFFPNDNMMIRIKDDLAIKEMKKWLDGILTDIERNNWKL